MRAGGCVPAIAMRCAGWSFTLSDMASTAISCVVPSALKNLAMTVHRNGSLVVNSPPSCRETAWHGAVRGFRAPRPVGKCAGTHSNIASAKLDAAALSIIKAAYAFVALQGEAGNKTTAMQTKKQRRRVSRTKRGPVGPEPAQGVMVGASHVRRWWVFDSNAATKQRMVLLPEGKAGTDARVPAEGPKVPQTSGPLATLATPPRPMAPAKVSRTPRPLAPLATIAPAVRPGTRGS